MTLIHERGFGNEGLIGCSIKLYQQSDQYTFIIKQETLDEHNFLDFTLNKNISSISLKDVTDNIEPVNDRLNVLVRITTIKFKTLYVRRDYEKWLCS